MACAAGGETLSAGGSFNASAAMNDSSASEPSTTAADTSDGSSSSSGAPGDGTDVSLPPASSTGVPTACGDGVADPGEDCDGEDLAAASCADFGFDEGVLQCTPTCDLVTEGCRSCGDGMRSIAEACDGIDLGGETCESQGYAGGTLACTPDCAALDTTDCAPLANCGNGERDGAEECDGADLGGASCESLGFDFGVLACAGGSCTYNTGGCDYLDCAGVGEFCLFDFDNPQSNCCPPGVGGNVFGLCALAVCQ